MIVINWQMVGKMLKGKRKILGITQLQTSKMIGMSQAFYGHIERGTRIPSVATLVRIAYALELSMDELMDACTELEPMA